MVRHLWCDLEPIVLNIAGAIANIAIHRGNKFAVANTQGAMEALIHCATWALGEARMNPLHQVARCLFSLAASRPNREFMVKSGCLDIISRMMGKEMHHDVQSNSTGALANIAMSEKLDMDFMTSHDMFEKLHSLLNKSTKNAVLRQASRSCFTLSSRDSLRTVMVELDFITPIAEVIKNPISTKEAKRDACGALANLTIGLESSKTQACNLGVLSHLVSILKHPIPEEPNLLRQVVRCVFSMAGPVVSKDEMISLGVIPLLVQHARDTQEDVQMNALGALANISLEEKHARHVVDQLAVPTLLWCAYKATKLENRRQACRALNLVFRTTETPRCLRSSEYQGSSGDFRLLRHDFRDMYEAAVGGHAGNEGGHAANQGRNGAVQGGVKLSFAFHETRPFTLLERHPSVDAHTLMRVKYSFSPNSKAHSFVVHAYMIQARCPRLWEYMHTTCARGTCPSLLSTPEEASFVFPDQWHFRKEAWLGLIEYIYSNGMYHNAAAVERSADVSRQIAVLGYMFQVPRLAALSFYNHDALRQQVFPDKDELVAMGESSWSRDMLKLPGMHGISCDVSFVVAPEWIHDEVMFQDLPAAKRPRVVGASPRRSRDLPGDWPEMQNWVGYTGGQSETELRRVCNAHMAVLATRSKYFACLFSAQWRVNKQEIMFDAPEEVLLVMLRYLYIGSDVGLCDVLNADPELALKTLEVAQHYLIPGLLSLCEQVLMQYVDEHNAVDMLVHMQSLHAPLLQLTCFHVIISKRIPVSPKSFTDELLYLHLERCAVAWGLPLARDTPEVAPMQVALHKSGILVQQAPPASDI